MSTKPFLVSKGLYPQVWTAELVSLKVALTVKAFFFFSPCVTQVGDSGKKPGSRMEVRFRGKSLKCFAVIISNFDSCYIAGIFPLIAHALIGQFGIT